MGDYALAEEVSPTVEFGARDGRPGVAMLLSGAIAMHGAGLGLDGDRENRRGERGRAGPDRENRRGERSRAGPDGSIR